MKYIGAIKWFYETEARLGYPETYQLYTVTVEIYEQIRRLTNKKGDTFEIKVPLFYLLETSKSLGDIDQVIEFDINSLSLSKFIEYLFLSDWQKMHPTEIMKLGHRLKGGTNCSWQKEFYDMLVYWGYTQGEDTNPSFPNRKHRFWVNKPNYKPRYISKLKNIKQEKGINNEI